MVHACCVALARGPGPPDVIRSCKPPLRVQLFMVLELLRSIGKKLCLAMHALVTCPVSSGSWRILATGNHDTVDLGEDAVGHAVRPNGRDDRPVLHTDDECEIIEQDERFLASF